MAGGTLKQVHDQERFVRLECDGTEPAPFVVVGADVDRTVLGRVVDDPHDALRASLRRRREHGYDAQARVARHLRHAKPDGVSPNLGGLAAPTGGTQASWAAAPASAPQHPRAAAFILPRAAVDRGATVGPGVVPAIPYPLEDVPCMSRRPHPFAGNSPTGAVFANPSSQ